MDNDFLNIYIWGDLEFSYFVLNAITMIFNGTETFLITAAVLSLLFFMWTFIKWSLNPEKNTYPVREWAFGIIFFMIFGGSAVSPRFQVNLISSTTGALRPISDVPLLAAFPSWLVSNVFYKLTMEFEDGLGIPGYGNLRGYNLSGDSKNPDPLSALVRLQELSNNKIVNRTHDLNIKNYIKECYIPANTMNASTDNPFKFDNARLYDPAFFANFRVEHRHLRMDYINLDGIKSYLPCTDAYTNLSNQVVRTERPTSDDKTFSSQAVLSAQSIGITEYEIQSAAQIINTNFVGEVNNPNPYTLMTNMFLAATIKEAINDDKGSLGVWADKMVFEAEKKRVAEAAGNRALFMKLYIPTITAIETFSFYIAPLLIILSILGGFGFSLIGKYLMLVLFINIWSFIKVFVDLFTALSIQRGFQLIVTDTELRPFSFSQYANTVADVESMLTVAANLTVAIPFFAMFLLYGGIHSVMGVMRTVTGGSTDGSNMAPSMATSMNGGVLQMGDTTNTHINSTGRIAESHATGVNSRYGSSGATSSILMGASGANQLITSQINTDTSAFNESMTTAWGTSARSGSGQNSGTTQNASTTRGVSWLDQQTDTLSGNHSYSQSQNAQVLSRLAATIGGKLAAGGNTTVADPEKQETMQSILNPGQGKNGKDNLKKGLVSLGFSADVAGQMVAGMTEADVRQFSQQVASSKANATSFMKDSNYSDANMYSDLKSYADETVKSDAFSNAHSKAESISNLTNKQAALSTQFGFDSGVTNTTTLGWNTLPSDFSTFEKVYNSLSSEQQQRIGLPTAQGGLGLGNSVGDVARELSAGDPNVMSDGIMLSQRLLGQLNKQDDNLTTASKDALMSSGIFNTLSGLAGPVNSHGFASASREYDNLATTLGTMSTDTSTIGKPDTSRVNTGPIVNTNADKFDANGLPISTVDTSQATANTDPKVPINVAGYQGAVALPTREALDEMLNTRYSDLSGIASAGKAANEGYVNFLEGVGDFSKAFTGREQLWGKDSAEWSKTVGAAANALGNNSLSLTKGLQELRDISHSDIAPLVARANNGDTEATMQVSRMNDALTYLNSSEGRFAVTAMGEKEGMQLVQSMRVLDSNLDSLTGSNTSLSRDQLDAVSTARADGSLTDNQARVIIGMGTNNDGLLTTIGSTLNNGGLQLTDEVNSALFAVSKGSASENATLRSIVDNSETMYNTTDNAWMRPHWQTQLASPGEIAAVYANASPSQNSDDYKKISNAAAKDIIQDSVLVSHNAGLIQHDGVSIQGFNAEFEINDRITNQVSNFSRKLVDGYDDGSFAERPQNLVDLAVGGRASAQELVYALSAYNGPANLGERLADSNLNGMGQALDFTMNDVKERATEAGLVNNAQDLRDQYNAFITK